MSTTKGTLSTVVTPNRRVPPASHLTSSTPRGGRGGGGALAAMCRATGEGLNSAMARRAAHFTIEALDANGWRRREGGEPFVVSIRGPGAVTTSLRDRQDGTYSCGWVASVSGTYWIVVSLHGEHIAGSPFGAHVNVPHADAKRSRATGAGLHQAIAGEQTSFRVDFADAGGRAVPAESLDLALDSAAGSERRDAASEAGFALGGLQAIEGADEGAFHALYSVSRSGAYELHVRLRSSGEPLIGSPFALTVRSGAAHAPSTELPIDDGPIRSSAGISDLLVVCAVDRLHNPCDSGRGGLTAEIVPADGAQERGYDDETIGIGGARSADVRVSVRDRDDGSYEVRWHGERRGTYRLAVRMRGIHVGRSPALLRMLSAPPDARACALQGDGLRHAVAGREAVVAVRCLDMYGNPVDADPRTRFWIELAGSRSLAEAGRGGKGGGAASGGKGGGSAARLTPHERVPPLDPNDPRGLQSCEASWLEDGLVELRYLTTRAGRFDMILWCEHEGEPGALIHAEDVLTVQPAAPTHVLSAIHQAGGFHGSTVRAGTTLALPLLLRDAHGNGAAHTSHVEILLAEPGHPEGSGLTTLGARPLEGHERLFAGGSPTRRGASAAQLSSPAGSSRSHGALDSPRSPRRSHGGASATTCAVSLAEPRSPRGACGRSPTSPSRGSVSSPHGPLSTLDGSEASRSRASNGSAGVRPLSPTRLASDGAGRSGGGEADEEAAELLCTHMVEHLLTHSGVHSLCITVDGKALRGSPLEFQVTAGQAFGARSTLLPPPNPTRTHTPSEFVVEARDRWGNRLCSGGATVAARTNGPGAMMVVVTDQHDGTYTVQLVAQCSGEYRLVVSLDGHQVKGSPYNVSVVHAGPPPDDLAPLTPRRIVNSPLDPSRLPGGSTPRGLTPRSRAPAQQHSARQCSARQHADAGGSSEIRRSASGPIVLQAHSPMGEASSAHLHAHQRAATPHSQSPAHTMYGTALAQVGRRPTALVTGSMATPRYMLGTSSANGRCAKLAGDSAASTPRDASAASSTPRRQKMPPPLPPPPPPRLSAFNAGGDGTPRDGLRGGPLRDPSRAHPAPEPERVAEGCAAASTSFVSGPSEVAMGMTAVLSIASCDVHGVPLQTGGEPFVVSVHGPAAVKTEVGDLDDGRYEVHVHAPPLSGDFRVAVTLRGRAIGGSPHAITVLAPVAHWAHCEVKGTALELATAGELSTFEIVANDAHHKRMTYGGEQYSVRLVRHADLDKERSGEARKKGKRGGGALGGGDTEVEAAGQETSETFGRVEDRRDGSYVASYVARRSGRYSLHVMSLKHGRPLSGSPWTLLVAPGPPHAPSSYLRGRDLGRAVCGEPTAFELVARDACGNEQLFGGEPWQATLQGPYQTNAEPLEVLLRDGGDGLYRGEYTAVLAGEYTLSVTLRGAHARGSPLRVTAGAGGVHAQRCTAEGSGLRAAIRNVPTSFKIIAKDAFGNRISRGAHGYGVRVRPPLSATKAPKVDLYDAGDGTCTCEWRPTVSGRHVISITLAGLPIGGSDFFCHVTPSA